jgi:hypothetical protein
LHFSKFDLDLDNNDSGEDLAHGSDGSDVLMFGAQHVVALVDCHPDMFVEVPPRPKEDDEGSDNDNIDTVPSCSKVSKNIDPATPFELSLRTMQKLVETIIEETVTRKTGKRDAVGILLYNTKPQKNGKRQRDNGEENKLDDDDDDKMDDESEDSSMSNDDDEIGAAPETNAHILLDLAPPGIKQFRTLRNLVDKKRRDVQNSFCPEPTDQEPRNAPLQIAIEEAMRIFINSKYVRYRDRVKSKDEIDSRAIWIFTNQANPYSASRMQLIENVANEAKEQNVEIIVFPLVVMKHASGLQRGLFVSPLFQSLVSEWYFERRFQDLVELEHDGLHLIYQTMKKNRRTHYGPLNILRSKRDAPIMVDWYSTVQLAKRPTKVHIDDETKL